MASEKLKVAIVCDWLIGTGGAERVVLELHRLFPDAPIYTSQYDQSAKTWYGDKWFDAADIRTGWLNRLPLSLRKFLPVLRAWYFSHLDLSGYDLVLSSTGAEAKAVKKNPGATHICYMHAPTHYYWARYEQYIQDPGFGKLDWLARLGLKLLVGPMRRWDKKAAAKPDHIVTNSRYSAEQIKKYYGREATVIHPPVDIDRFKKLNKLSNHEAPFVTAGRQTPYKRIDLAVAAATKTGFPLLVVGNGPDHSRLVTMAGGNVKFVTGASDKQVAEIFASARAMLFPGVDDFGVVAIEALAAGTPVIAYRGGGALDYVNETTGAFFEEQTVESLAKALKSFDPKEYDSSTIRNAAKEFSAKRFRQQITGLISSSGS